MNELYIVSSSGLYGHYGKGPTLEAAYAAYRKAGGRKTVTGPHGRRRKAVMFEWRFTSELPFAPFDRDATDREADAWIGRDGSINWVRCSREHLNPATAEAEQ